MELYEFQIELTFKLQVEHDICKDSISQALTEYHSYVMNNSYCILYMYLR